MRPARWRCQNIGVAVVVIGGKAAVGDGDCHMVGARGERRAHLGFDIVVARRAFTGGEQAIAEHSRWIEIVRARVDVNLSGVRDELGGVVKLRGVEQLLCLGQRGLVEPLHALHNLRRRYSAYRPAMQRRRSSHEHYREGLAIRALALVFWPFGTIITLGMRKTLRLIKRRKRMGLFDMFKKKAEPAAAAAPASVSASAGADVLCSPVKGKVIKMADVPDPVFGGEVLGKGCAVWPEDDLVYAPCDGKVTVTMGHAVGLQSDSGIEVLVHVGVDTVNMNGDGFEGFVKADDVVKAGQPILKIDRAKIAAAGYKDCVVVAVSNTAEFADVELAVEAESAVAAGDVIVKVVRK